MSITKFAPLSTAPWTGLGWNTSPFQHSIKLRSTLPKSLASTPSCMICAQRPAPLTLVRIRIWTSAPSAMNHDMILKYLHRVTGIKRSRSVSFKQSHLVLNYRRCGTVWKVPKQCDTGERRPKILLIVWHKRVLK